MKCVACGYQKFRQRGSKKGYDLQQCCRCGTVVLDPLPEEEEVVGLYESSYHMTGHYMRKADKKIRRSRRRIERLKKLANGNRFLDVGCSVGMTVEAAVAGGFDATGIDLDAPAVEIAKGRVPGADFAATSIEEMSRSGETFDVIYTAEVIEHTTDPKSFVRSLLRLMRPKGLVFLTTPDAGHWRVPKALPEWNEVNPPFHIYLFSQQALRTLFTSHGFDHIWFKFNIKPGIRLFARAP